MKTLTYSLMLTIGLLATTALAEDQAPKNSPETAAIVGQRIFSGSHGLSRRSVRTVPATVKTDAEPALEPVMSQPVYFPTGGQTPQSMGSDVAIPLPPMDTPGDHGIKVEQARILSEQARGIADENKFHRSEHFVARKKMLADHYTQVRLDHETRVAHGQQLLAQRRRTTHRDAYRLTANELNLATGQIAWPVALQGSSCDKRRNHMQELFRQLVTYGDSQSSTLSEITRSVELWSQELKGQRSSVSPQDYLAAQKFLTGIKYTAEALAETT